MNTAPTSSELNGHAPVNGAPAPVAPEQPGLLRRLAAQQKAAHSTTRGVFEQHDPLPRERDKHGDPIGRVKVFIAPPAADEEALENTPLAGALEVIAAQSPGRAAWLHHFYNHRVRPALARLHDVTREEWERAARHNAEVERHNEALEARRADLEAERDEKTRADHEANVALDTPLAEAHNRAAEKVALAGGAYDAANPSPSCVLRHERLHERAIAAGLRVPFAEDDAPARTAAYAAMLLTGVTGTVVGVSAGLMGGVLHAARLGDELPQIAACATVGIGAAFAARKGIKGLAFNASNRYWMPHSVSSWGPWLGFTLTAMTGVAAIDAVVEQNGLLKLSLLQTAFGGRGLSSTAALLAGLLFSAPYVVACAVDGYFAGRSGACTNRIKAEQERLWHEADESVRSNPNVQAALDAIARVGELLRQKTALGARVEAVAAPFNVEIGVLERQKREPQDDLDMAARHRIQDVTDNWHGAQLLFDHQFEETLGSIEPDAGGSFWQRLLRALFGPRTLKGRSRDGMRRV